MAQNNVTPNNNNQNDDNNINNNNKNNNNKNNNQPMFKVYAAMDFGTDGTGLAYCLPFTQSVYVHNKWRRWNKNKKNNNQRIKPKTAILLDKDGKFVAFGDNALRIYMNMKDETSMLFEHFKMNLYNRPDYDGQIDDQKNDISSVQIKTQLTAMNGRKYSSAKVFIAALKHLKKEAFGVFKRNKLEIKSYKDVCWIVTIPAIWDDIAKAKMREWAIAAGMVDPNIENHLLLRYEPDCASLSIQSEIMGKAITNISGNNNKNNDDDNKDNAPDDQDDQKIEPKLLQNEKYILIDAGGGTVDVACHQILANHSVKELLRPSGGPWGDMHIDTYFIGILSDIFNAEWVKEFKTIEPNIYLELLDNFRRSKWTFNDDIASVSASAWHNVMLPMEFVEFMEDKFEENPHNNYNDVEDIVENFQLNGIFNGFKLDGESFRINKKVWKSLLFDRLINPIIEHIKKLLTHNNMINTKYLCIVGGFGSIKYFQKCIKKVFGINSIYKLDIIIPQRPILSVLDGAARMSMKKDFVKARVLAKTYGDFTDNISLVGNNYSRVFEPWCKINTTIKVDAKPQPHVFHRFSHGQKFLPFCIYSTDENEKEFTCLVNDVIEFPDNAMQLDAVFEVNYGGTTLSIYGQVRDRPKTRKKLEINADLK